MTMNSRLNVELHPLQNVDILSIIFSYCSVKDLRNIRLVGSKAWLNASHTRWRNKTVLKIKPTRRSGQIRGGVTFPELQKSYSNAKDPLGYRRKPPKNFKFEALHLDRESYDFSCFLENFSTNLRHLTLTNCEFVSWKNFMRTMTFNLPNLVELKLDESTSIPGFTPGYYPEHRNLKTLIIQGGLYDCIFRYGSPERKAFLRYFPKLEDLQIKCKSATDSKDEGQLFLKAIAEIRQEDLSKLLIKNLHMSLRGINDSQAIPSLPLESFTGDIDDITDLKRFSETLKFAKFIFAEETKNRKSIGEISLPNLKELHLDGRPMHVFQNLDKLKARKLESLFVEYSTLKFVDHLNCVNINLNEARFENVKKLDCYITSTKLVINLQGFKELSRCMPNVKHVKMPLTRKAFRELCRAWPDLLTLTISHRIGRVTNLDDEIITGIEPGHGKVRGERHPNITDLKLLTDFVCSGRLTDHSVYCGFLQLPMLRRLNARFVKISDEAESVLRKKVTMLEIRKIKDGREIK